MPLVASLGTAGVGYWFFSQDLDDGQSFGQRLLRDFESFNDWSRDVRVVIDFVYMRICRYF